jgi:hypothetical protein
VLGPHAKLERSLNKLFSRWSARCGAMLGHIVQQDPG